MASALAEPGAWLWISAVAFLVYACSLPPLEVSDDLLRQLLLSRELVEGATPQSIGSLSGFRGLRHGALWTRYLGLSIDGGVDLLVLDALRWLVALGMACATGLVFRLAGGPRVRAEADHLIGGARAWSRVAPALAAALLFSALLWRYFPLRTLANPSLQPLPLVAALLWMGRSMRRGRVRDLGLAALAAAIAADAHLSGLTLFAGLIVTASASGRRPILGLALVAAIPISFWALVSADALKANLSAPTSAAALLLAGAVVGLASLGLGLRSRVRGWSPRRRQAFTWALCAAPLPGLLATVGLGEALSLQGRLLSLVVPLLLLLAPALSWGLERAWRDLPRLGAALALGLVALALVAWLAALGRGSNWQVRENGWCLDELQDVSRHLDERGCSFEEAFGRVRGPATNDLLVGHAVFGESEPWPRARRQEAVREKDLQIVKLGAGALRQMAAWRAGFKGWQTLSARDPVRVVARPYRSWIQRDGVEICIDEEPCVTTAWRWTGSRSFGPSYTDKGSLLLPPFRPGGALDRPLPELGATRIRVPLAPLGTDAFRSFHLPILNRCAWQIEAVAGLPHRGDFPGRHAVVRARRDVAVPAPSGEPSITFVTPRGQGCYELSPPTLLELSPGDFGLRRMAKGGHFGALLDD